MVLGLTGFAGCLNISVVRNSGKVRLALCPGYYCGGLLEVRRLEYWVGVEMEELVEVDEPVEVEAEEPVELEKLVEVEEEKLVEVEKLVGVEEPHPFLEQSEVE